MKQLDTCPAFISPSLYFCSKVLRRHSFGARCWERQKRMFSRLRSIFIRHSRCAPLSWRSPTSCPSPALEKLVLGGPGSSCMFLSQPCCHKLPYAAIVQLCPTFFDLHQSIQDSFSAIFEGFVVSRWLHETKNMIFISVAVRTF